MRFLLAILFPPLAVLLCGKPVQFILNLVLCLIGIASVFVIVGLLLPVPVIHAILVVASHHADKRTKKIVSAIKKS